MPSDRVTVLEAIGMAGDLQLTGVRNNVLVVREAKGQRQEFRLDLTDKSIYSSPAYYLLQNDVVYVEPNKGARFQGQNVQIFTQVVTPVLSLMLSIYTLFALN
jgi:polysaccharide export outer membrane protein